MGDFERWKRLFAEYDARKQAEKRAQSNEAEPKETDKGKEKGNDGRKKCN